MVLKILEIAKFYQLKKGIILLKKCQIYGILMYVSKYFKL